MTKTSTMPHTDIKRGGWIDRFLPRAAGPYARLMRLDRPIGIWLLLLPCWWGLALATDGFPNLFYLVLFALGSVAMRSAGCVINDIYDRKIDALVKRTCVRPLPSGELTLPKAFALLGILLFIGFVILLQFNVFTIYLGVASLGLVFTYPLAKRFTWWPQLVLGFTFNWGAMMGWSALHGNLDMAPLVLYSAGLFWTLGYDTIYAHQDKEDDAIVGVKSLALYLKKRARFWISFFFALFFCLLLLSGYLAGLGAVFYFLLLAPLAHILWQMKTWRIDDPLDCLVKFKSNRDLGLLVFCALLFDRIL